MQPDKLQIALRPRPAPQALDLGFALLHAHAGAVYKTWLALWLPLCALAALLIALLPDYTLAWTLLPWWLRPLLERGPLFVLSRQVFGEDVTWRQALRAWPRQLGGGWIRLLTWWRWVMPGRGLYQPIWQLEQARGAAAAERRNAIGRNGTGAAAYRFGLACAHFEGVLSLGLLALLSLFLGDGTSINPLAIFAQHKHGNLLDFLAMGGVTVAGAIMGPVYTACCFTLYLNRRATLEAWDIEITLRQIQAPGARRAQAGHASPLLLAGIGMAALSAMGAKIAAGSAAAVLAAALALAAPAARAEPLAPAAPAPGAVPGAAPCRPPAMLQSPIGKHAPPQDAGQAALRKELRQLYGSEDLRGYRCVESWHLKNFKAKTVQTLPKRPDFSALALALKLVLIAGGIALTGWLLYRYRGKLAGLLPAPTALAATEIAGLDIRAESLPDNVAGAVRSLWDTGDRRGALALLYRATLSRLVQQDGLPLAQGATEGDCLRLARQAALPPARYRVAADATALWLDGAYGGRWPDGAAVHAACAAWDAQFGHRAASAAEAQA